MTLLNPLAPPFGAHAAPAKPSLAATVKHMAGMLWYDMLTELNKSGLDATSLGTGGDDFQSLFLWNIAQNDFGKYDTGLTNAAIKQMGGTAAPDAATPPAPAVTQYPAPILQSLQFSDAVQTTAGAVPAPAAIQSSAPPSDLVTQATNFAKAIWPQIAAAAQQLGVPPVAVLAQSALETGWGNAASGHNLFGIKALDGQSATTRPTHEMVDGVLTAQDAAFRDYASPGQSISDYVGLIQSGYQNAAGQSTVSGFAQALQQGGYATDPHYATKIVSISQSPLMAQVLQAIGSTSSTSPNNTGGP